MASLTDVFSCPICLERYETPRALPCLHTFCEKCLTDWVKHRAVTEPATSYPRNTAACFPCPVCKENVQVPVEGIKGFKHNFFLSGQITKQQHQGESSGAEDVDDVDRGRVCSRCEETGVVKLCLRCVDWLCGPCCTDHSRVKATRSHILASHKQLVEFAYAENIVGDNLAYCTEHEHESYLVELYCISCHQLICAACKSASHDGNQHSTLLITAKVTDVRLSLINHVEKLRKKAEELNRHRVVLDKTKADIWARHRTAIKEMDRTIHSLHKVIKAVRVRTCKEIKQKLVENSKTVQDEYNCVSNTLSVISAVEENMKAMLDEGRDHVLMTEAPALCQQAAESIRDNGRCVSIQVMVPSWQASDKDALEDTITSVLSTVKYRNKCYTLTEKTGPSPGLGGSMVDLMELADLPHGERRPNKKKKKLEKRCPSLTLSDFNVNPDMTTSSVSDLEEPLSPPRANTEQMSQQMENLLRDFDPLGDDWRDLPELPATTDGVYAADDGNSSSASENEDNAESTSAEFMSEPPVGPFYPASESNALEGVASQPSLQHPPQSPHHPHRPPHHHPHHRPPRDHPREHGPPWHGPPDAGCPPLRHPRPRHHGPRGFHRHAPQGWQGHGNWFR